MFQFLPSKVYTTPPGTPAQTVPTLRELAKKLLSISFLGLKLRIVRNIPFFSFTSTLDDPFTLL